MITLNLPDMPQGQQTGLDSQPSPHNKLRRKLLSYSMLNALAEMHLNILFHLSDYPNKGKQGTEFGTRTENSHRERIMGSASSSVLSTRKMRHLNCESDFKSKKLQTPQRFKLQRD